mmetsp:Transcript_26273/g.29249  ORF Transcript_26273/g.29249 Transcript_26273/m.29249 type:complete len:373 (+) Transcript_26273:375-1493(+)
MGRRWVYGATQALERGAIGLVVRDETFAVPGSLNYIRLINTASYSSGIPTVTTGDDLGDILDDLDEIFNGSYPSKNVTLVNGDDNPWWGINVVGFTFFSIFIGFLAILAASMAIYKINNITTRTGTFFSVPIFCLYVEAIANTVRAIYVVIDPLYSRRIFPKLIHDVLYVGLTSLSLTTTVLIAFYWHDILNSSTALRERHKYGTQRLLIPSIFIVSTFVVVEITGGIILAFLDFGSIYLAYQLVLFLASLVSAGYLLVMGSIVVHRLNTVQAKSKILTRIKHITVQIMISSLCIFIYAITTIFTAFPSYRTPNGFFITWTIYWIALVITSLLQISAIRKRPQQNVPSSSGGELNEISTSTNLPISTNQTHL